MAHSPGKTKGTYGKTRAAEKKAALDQCRKMKTSFQHWKWQFLESTFSVPPKM